MLYLCLLLDLFYSTQELYGTDIKAAAHNCLLLSLTRNDNSEQRGTSVGKQLLWTAERQPLPLLRYRNVIRKVMGMAFTIKS